MPIRNQVQLITYPDSLGGDLPALNGLLEGHFSGVFGGVHILPPFPSSGDRGFAPRTYFEIEPQFGGWEDVRRLGERVDVLLDLMVNHISRQSVYFQDFAEKGRKSVYADLFLTLDKVWLGGNPDPGDVKRIFLRRPEHPFAELSIQETGETEQVWATFGTRDWSEQIDIDVRAPAARKLFTEILAHMSRQGVRILRLDAIAFVIKKPGTSCFFVEPEIYDFLSWIQGEAHRVGIELLPEVHAHYAIQRKLSDHGSWVYNFVLPLLILHTLMNRTGRVLQEHLRNCPRKQFTMLDCHDGIPVQPDIDGIVQIDDAQAVVQACLRRGANLSRIFSIQHRSRPDFDAHQINCTYFSALGQDEQAYLAARAIQLFAPGIPQVYYVGLLAGENDQAGVERTGERRAINRHNYTVEEVEAALRKPVVQRLLKLIRFRNAHAAFGGDFQVLETGNREVGMAWEKGAQKCALRVDLESFQITIEYTDEAGEARQFGP
jgi:sucrose phosphorylase